MLHSHVPTLTAVLHHSCVVVHHLSGHTGKFLQRRCVGMNLLPRASCRSPPKSSLRGPLNEGGDNTVKKGKRCGEKTKCPGSRGNVSGKYGHCALNGRATILRTPTSQAKTEDPHKALILISLNESSVFAGGCFGQKNLGKGAKMSEDWGVGMLLRV